MVVFFLSKPVGLSFRSLESCTTAAEGIRPMKAEDITEEIFEWRTDVAYRSPINSARKISSTRSVWRRSSGTLRTSVPRSICSSSTYSSSSLNAFVQNCGQGHRLGAHHDLQPQLKERNRGSRWWNCTSSGTTSNPSVRPSRPSSAATSKWCRRTRPTFR